ncbi:MAG: SIS domain-containing protein [Chloroflexota bacterium]|nr:SIS domain-containing protein [Chloroflexota bacterium]
MDSINWINTYLRDVSLLLDELSAEQIDAAAGQLLDAWRRQARVFVCGNGGSAAIASHFAGDLNKGTNVAGRHRFRAMSLVDNVPALMAWSNDDGYETGMAEQLRNFVEPGDLVIGFSGSGNSANVLNTIRLARQAGASTIGICGFDGGGLLQLSDVTIQVPSHGMEQVEDVFSVICHGLLFALRRRIRMEPPSGDALLASAQDAYPEE